MTKKSEKPTRKRKGKSNAIAIAESSILQNLNQWSLQPISQIGEEENNLNQTLSTENDEPFCDDIVEYFSDGNTGATKEVF